MTESQVSRGNSSSAPMSFDWRLILALIAVTVVCASFWLDPGITRPFPGVSVALGGFAALLGALSSAQHPWSPRARVTMNTVAVLIVWIGLTSLHTVDAFRSQQTLSSWIGAAGIFTLLTAGISSLVQWRVLIWTLNLWSTLLCLLGFAKLSATNPHLTATFSNQDTFSVVPMLTIFLVLSLLTIKNPVFKLFNYGQLMVLGLAVLRSSSRAGLIGCCLGLIFVGLSGRLPRKKARVSFRGPVVVAFVGVLVIALISGNLAPMVGRIDELKKGSDSQGVAMRADVLVYGLKASTEHPVLGTGPGTFALTYQKFRPPSLVPSYIYVNVAHNDYVEAIVEFGWVGFAMIGFLYILLFLKCIRMIRHGIAIWESRCLMGALASILGFSALNFAISVPCILFLQFAVFGFAQSIPTPVAARSKRSPHQIIVSGLLAVAGIWAFQFGVHIAMGNRQAEKAQTLITNLRWEESIQSLDSAIRWQPNNAAAYLARGYIESRILQFKDTPETKSRADAFLSKAYSLSPLDPKVTQTLLNYYEVSKQYEQAEKIYREIMRNSPYRELGYRKLVLLQMLQKKLPEAAQTLHSYLREDATIEKTLVSVLIQLEVEHKGHGISLLHEWATNDTEVSTTKALARSTVDQALRENRLDIAQRIWNFLKEGNPKDLQVLYQGSRLFDKLGKTKERDEILTNLITADSKSPKEQDVIDRAIGDWANQQKDLLAPNSKTRIVLERRLKDRPRSVAIRLKLSEIYLRTKNAEDASEVIARGLDVAPGDPHLLARMGTCVSAQGLPELAQGYYNQALKIDAENAEALAGRSHKPIKW